MSDNEKTTSLTETNKWYSVFDFLEYHRKEYYLVSNTHLNRIYALSV